MTDVVFQGRRQQEDIVESKLKILWSDNLLMQCDTIITAINVALSVLTMCNIAE